MGHFDICMRPRRAALCARAAVLCVILTATFGCVAAASAPGDDFAAGGRAPHFEPLPMLDAQPTLKPQAYVADDTPTAGKTEVAPQSAVVPPNASQPPAQPATTEAQPATEVKPVDLQRCN